MKTRIVRIFPLIFYLAIVSSRTADAAPSLASLAYFNQLIADGRFDSELAAGAQAAHSQIISSYAFRLQSCAPALMATTNSDRIEPLRSEARGGIGKREKDPNATINGRT